MQYNIYCINEGFISITFPFAGVAAYGVYGIPQEPVSCLSLFVYFIECALQHTYYDDITFTLRTACSPVLTIKRNFSNSRSSGSHFSIFHIEDMILCMQYIYILTTY